MLSYRDQQVMQRERLAEFIHLAGPEAKAAFHDLLLLGRKPTMEDIAEAARRRGADVDVVVAFFGYLPTSRTGGPPYADVRDPRNVLLPVYLQSEPHRWAYVAFEGVARGFFGKNWTPCCRVLYESQETPDET